MGTSDQERGAFVSFRRAVLEHVCKQVEMIPERQRDRNVAARERKAVPGKASRVLERKEGLRTPSKAGFCAAPRGLTGVAGSAGRLRGSCLSDLGAQ